MPSGIRAVKPSRRRDQPGAGRARPGFGSLPEVVACKLKLGAVGRGAATVGDLEAVLHIAHGEVPDPARAGIGAEEVQDLADVHVGGVDLRRADEGIHVGVAVLAPVDVPRVIADVDVAQLAAIGGQRGERVTIAPARGDGPRDAATVGIAGVVEPKHHLLALGFVPNVVGDRPGASRWGGNGEFTVELGDRGELPSDVFANVGVGLDAKVGVVGLYPPVVVAVNPKLLRAGSGGGAPHVVVDGEAVGGDIGVFVFTAQELGGSDLRREKRRDGDQAGG